MTFHIYQSQLTDKAEFETAVQRYIVALHAYLHTVGKPRPTAHHLIENSVKRVQSNGQPDIYVPDYEIIDDVTRDLQQKKADLANQVMMAEAAAREKVVPQGKMRLLSLKYQEASSKSLSNRTPEDQVRITQSETIRKSFERIDLLAAKALHDIEDLTEENIDQWKMPSIE
jgi:hypothetical protein